MYYYPSHYEYRYLHPSDYSTVDNTTTPIRQITDNYYYGNPYVSSYNDGRFELLRRTPIYSSHRESSLPREIPHRAYRAGSIPPVRETSPAVEEARRHIRASSLPPVETEPLRDPSRPSIVHFTPNVADPKAPSTTYSYYTRLPDTPGNKMPDQPRRMYTANPVTFGPRIYTSLSVFPTMRHSSCALLTPIDRYRYRTVPTKSYNAEYRPYSNSYYSYPTPTRSTSSAYRQSDIYPTRFQINRVTSPSTDRFYANRRTLY